MKSKNFPGITTQDLDAFFEAYAAKDITKNGHFGPKSPNPIVRAIHAGVWITADQFESVLLAAIKIDRPRVGNKGGGNWNCLNVVGKLALMNRRNRARDIRAIVAAEAK